MNNFLENGGKGKATPKATSTISNKDMKTKERKIVPITLRITENQGLGCIICRGPQESPGIIVQKLKPDGIAIESGLSPGDQILECNGVSLEGVSFQDAVYQLKSSRQLDLIVKKGVAIKFVNEKNSQTVNRTTIQDGKDVIDNSTEKDLREEESAKLQAEKLKLEQTKIDLDRKKLELEHERLKQKSDALEFEKKQFEDEKRNTLLNLKKSQSHDAYQVPSNIHPPLSKQDSDSPSTGSSGGLAGAIQNELLRRKANAKSSLEGSIRDLNKENDLKLKRMSSVTSVLKSDQHDQLIAEFKKVHQKMFNASNTEDEESNNSQISNNGEKLKVTFKDDVINDEANTSNSYLADNGRLLFRPNKSPPPPPPIRSSSITPTSSLSPSEGSNSSTKSSSTSVSSTMQPILSTFKPNSRIIHSASNSSPEIPTPDYDLSPNLKSGLQGHKKNGSRNMSGIENKNDNNKRLSMNSDYVLPTLNRQNSDTDAGIILDELNNANTIQSRNESTGRIFESNSMKKHNFAKSSSALSKSSFARRHPPITDRVELPSLILEEPVQVSIPSKANIRPPPIYFEPERIAPPLVPISSYDTSASKPSDMLQFHKRLDTLKAYNRYSYSHEDLSKTVHIDEGLIAAQDYRVTNAGKMIKPAKADMIKTSSKVNFVSNASMKLSKASSQSYSDLSQSNYEYKSSQRTLDIKQDHNRTQSSNIPQKSIKKYPAPPPPPPPPMPSISHKGIS